MDKYKKSKVFGGTLIVAGTSMGGAMLALPITTGLFGFWGTILILLCCWLFMYWTSTLILEATLHFPKEASFVTMARESLGQSGILITWTSFLLFFYILLSAYLTASGDLIWSFFPLAAQSYAWAKILPLLIIFGPSIYFGFSFLEHINRYLMMVMLLVFSLIVAFLLPHKPQGLLNHFDLAFSLLSFSVVVTGFGFHGTIPTLVTYLEKDSKNIKKCLFWGSFLTLAAYCIWLLVNLNLIPVKGPFGLAHAYEFDTPLSLLLEHYSQNRTMVSLAKLFSLFAITTSFLGVAQGLFDFIKDGFKGQRFSHTKSLSFFLTFLPPVFIILFFRKGFISLLDYAGVLASIILGIIPILIVRNLRKRNKNTLAFRAFGGNWSLVLGMLFFVFVVLLVVLKNIGLISFSVQHLL